MAAQLGIVSAIPTVSRVPPRRQGTLAAKLARATADVAVAYLDATRQHGGADGAIFEPTRRDRGSQ